MHLVVLFGPPAVGKMTVGLALEARTGLRLFHNHHAIDLALRFFDFGTPEFSRLVGALRRSVFEAVAASELPGLIFTYVWALDDARDHAFVAEVVAIFEARGATVHFVELSATQEERLRRNETPLRLAEKSPKRDLARSRAHLLAADATYQLNTSGGDFPYADRHLRLETTALAPEEVAERIIAALGLPRSDTSASAPRSGERRRQDGQDGQE
ncbi:MAG TPA: AAA family ATPase [Gemmatimonadaceae bacterium]|nr:AAA family ATPase [Gemmatimonadaceae bacterium]